MNRCAIVLVIGILNACSSYEVRDDPWTDLLVSEEPESRGRELPVLPELVEVDSGILMSFDGFDELERYQIVSDGNLVILKELAIALDEMNRANNDLVRAGQSEFRLSENRAIALSEERSARWWDKVLWGAVGILGIGAAIAN